MWKMPGSDPPPKCGIFHIFFLTGSLIVKKYILWNEVAPQHLTWLMYGSRNKCTFTLSCNSSLNIKCNNRCPVVSTFTCSLHLPAVRSTSIHEIKIQETKHQCSQHNMKTQPDSSYKKQSPNHSFHLKYYWASPQWKANLFLSFSLSLRKLQCAIKFNKMIFSWSFDLTDVMNTISFSKSFSLN